MAKYTFEQINDIIVKNPNEKLIAEARTKNKNYILNTYGVGLKDAIKQEDYFENADIYKSRSQLALSNKRYAGQKHSRKKNRYSQLVVDLVISNYQRIRKLQWMHC